MLQLCKSAGASVNGHATQNSALIHRYCGIRCLKLAMFPPHCNRLMRCSYLTDRSMKPSLAARTGACILTGLATVALGMPANAEVQYGQKITNNLRSCAPGAGPAVRVTIRGIKSSTGKVRLQSYRATKSEWLEKGRWINRIEVPARKGTMTICMPVPKEGNYAFAARHDANGNRKTDITSDGGAMSNNPSINIFNLGKPSVDKTRFSVGKTVKKITINMLYFG